MIRWGYLIPRLLIVGGIIFAFNILLDPIIHRTLVGVAYRGTRTQIEMDDLDVGVLKSTIDVRDLTVAHAKLSREKLFDADHLHFDLNTAELWRKRFVVDHAYVTGLRFDMERREGEEFEFDPVFKFKKKPESADKPKSNLLATAKGILERELTDKLVTLQLVKRHKEEWPTRYSALKSRVDAIKKATEKIERDIKARPDGSAGRVALAYATLEAVSRLHQDTTNTRQEFVQTAQQISVDRRGLSVAIAKDREFLEAQMPLVQLNAEAWSHKLLGERMTANLKRLLHVVGICRETVPSAKNIKRPRKKRGRTIDFHSKTAPGFLVKQLLLQGQGRFEGKPFDFAALTNNISSAPELVAKPTRIRFKTRGNLVSAGQAEIDLREDIPHYRISMKLPGKLTGKQQLKIDDWRLGMQTGLTVFFADIRMNDDVLQGGIRIQHKQLRLLPEAMGNERLVQNVMRGLSDINSIDSTLLLSGTPRRPKLELKTDLGSKVVDVMNSALEDYMAVKKQELLQSFSNKVNDELRGLESLWSGENTHLNSMLAETYAKLDELKSQLASRNGAGQKIMKGIGRFLQR